MPTPAQTRHTVEKVLAITNDKPLTLGFYRERRQDAIREAYRQFSGQRLEEELEHIRSNLFRDLLRELLLFQRADDLQFDQEKIVEEYLDTFMETNEISDREALKTLLMKEGMTVEDLSNQIRRSIIPQLVVRREVTGRIEISEREALEYYENNKDEFNAPGTIRIVMLFFEFDEEGKEEMAYAVANKLQMNVAIPDVVAEFGLDSYQVQPRMYQKGDLMEELERIAFNMKEGETTDPIPAEKGYYVIHIIEPYIHGTLPFEKVHEDIASKLKDISFADELDKYFEELDEHYGTEIFDDNPEAIVR